MIISITFPLLNEKPSSFDSTSSTANIWTWWPNTKDAMLISKVIVTSPLSQSSENLQTVSLFIKKDIRLIYKISVLIYKIQAMSIMEF